MARPAWSPARVTGLLFSLAAVGHTVTQLPAVAQSFGYGLAPFWALSVMGAGLFWAFATELFEDRQRLDPMRFVPALTLLGTGLGMAMTIGIPSDAFAIAHKLIGLALMGHVLLIVWHGWRNDLVESRRRLRGPLLVAAALYAVAVIAVETTEVVWGAASFLSPMAALALLLLGMASIRALLLADPELFAGPQRAQPSSKPILDGGESNLAEKLERLMRSQRVYREEALSIGALALKVGVPEYRLRRLINQQLGYRNFNAYLNEWRLDEAKQALADPEQRDVPVSTIALDAGFQSLGPFNRAFKANTGLTPTEFRSQAISARSPASL